MNHRPRTYVLAIAALLAAPCAMAASALPAPTVTQALREARHSLLVKPGSLGGDAAPILQEALKHARYIAVGEDHVTREIPAFVSTLCDVMAPDLKALVLEVGPSTAGMLTPVLRSRDRIERMAQFNHDYPNAVAFLDTRADNDMAAHCLSTQGAHVQLIGIDQEFIGAGALLLDRILATPLSPATRSLVESMRDRERNAVVQAEASGDPSGLLLLAGSQGELDGLQRAITRDGNAQAKELFKELRVSHDIYHLNAIGDADANGSRARLMKRNLVRALPSTGKVLFKLGDWHLYKGINPLGNRDVGNFIAERSEGEGSQSLHIIVLGAQGTHATFAGFSKGLKTQAFKMPDDPDYHWLKLATDQQVGDGWTLFDLRALRQRSLTGLDADWTRVINGYDLMVIIPELTPSELITGT